MSSLDWNSIRADFPVLERFRYFYTASGGPIPRPVFEKIVEYNQQAMEFGDCFWEENLKRREEVRRMAAEFIGASAEDVEFIPSTAAGMNLIAYLLSEQGDALAATLEFPDSTLPWLAREDGGVRWVDPEPDGSVPARKFKDALGELVGVIVASHVQFSNGFRQDLAELAAIKGGRPFVVNATQSLGAFAIDVHKMGIDALCANSYKWLLAGYGCGILYTTPEVRARKPGPGVGWMAVKDRDALRNDRFELLDSAARYNWGSPPFPNIFALGASLEYLNAIGIENIQSRVLELNRCLADRLVKAGFEILSPLTPDKYRSGEILLKLPDPQRAVKALKVQGILVTIKPQGIRIATHFFNNQEDIEALAEALTEIA